MTLVLVVNGNTIQATDVNSLINILQQPGSGQEKGHYILAMPGYVNNATLGTYVPSISRGSTPVSVSIDVADVSPGATMINATPNTDHLTANGFHVYDFSSGAQPNPVAGGNYTIQF